MKFFFPILGLAAVVCAQVPEASQAQNARRFTHPVALMAAAQTSALNTSSASQHNVVWTSRSKDSSGSMPLGNGDIGLNVWVEESGDVVFYVSKTDAWSETGRLLKIGRVRVRTRPNLFGAGPFQQTLQIDKGQIVMTGGKPEARITIWVDANQPVIRVETEAPQPVEVQVFYERWRDQLRRLEGQETSSAFGLDNGPEPVLSLPDSLQLDAEDRVVWYHRNTKSSFKNILKHQGLEEAMAGFPDVLQDLTFGAAIAGENFTRMNPTALRTRVPQSRQAVSIYVLTSTSDSAEAWTSELSKLVARVSQLSVDDRRAAHYKWWDDFWNRSSINILGGLDGKAVSDGYALQRFIDACGGRGGFPIKANGSIFTVDGKEGENQFDADYRRGGGPYRFQNTRLIYWPMLASGDSDLMLPFFRMYRESLMLAERRTRTYFSHEGGFFPETMYFFGAYPDSVYGWNRSGKQPSYVENPSVRNAFQGSLELLAMMLEYNAYNGDKRFVRDTLTPVAEAVLQFYDKHYPRDDKGMLRITPGQALDTWQNASNPLPDIAGLRFVLNALNTQKISLQRPASQAAKRLLQQLPDLPTRKVNGRTVLLPAAETSGEAKGTQNPELYAVFPYRFYGVNKPDLEIGRATFEARRFKNSGPEADDPIQAAFLGITRTAQQNVVENFAAQPSGRFPAFWGPNTGWTPDQAPGHIAMLTLQSMLLQSDGNKMVVFPAWPKNWDVEFKLHAPQNTTIEGVYRAGKIEKLTVTPDKRSADVVKMEPE